MFYKYKIFQHLIFANAFSINLYPGFSMNGIEFRDSDNRLVSLSSPIGGSNSYHIYIDKFYYGNIVFVNGEWTGHLNDNELTTEDIQIFGELITSNLKK